MNLLTHNDNHYMKLALSEAQTASEKGEIPIGAIIVSHHTIIAKDHNRTEQLKDATAHAEMLAITAAQNYMGAKYLNECTLYVTLEPCCMCAGALFWTQIGKVVIGAIDKERGFTNYNKPIIHPKTEITTSIMTSECEWLIKKFFKNMRTNRSR